ncbi:MAG: HAD family phosphatase [Verrucomicrobiota bacterium]
MKLTAIIFDMDGVIVDSEPLHERAFREVFEELGYAHNHGVEFSAYYGKSDLVLWKDFVARHRPAQTLEELLALKEGRFSALLDAEEPIFAGLPELLEKTGARYTLGLASGSRHATIQSVLRLRNLRRHFKAIVSSEDVKHGKPAPDVFLRTAELLGVAPADCWVIEDSAAGVEGALAAGMRVVAITNTLPADKLSRAHHVVGTYAEIEAIVL